MFDLRNAVISELDRLGGEPVFASTRVPVRSLFNHIRKGLTLDQFLDDFEGVPREHVLAVLKFAQDTIIRRAQS